MSSACWFLIESLFSHVCLLSRKIIIYVGDKMLRFWRSIRKKRMILEFYEKYSRCNFKKSDKKSLGEWYREYACANKFKFYLFSLIGIIAPLIVTAFNALNMISGDLVKVVTVICSLTNFFFSTSYLALTRCRKMENISRCDRKH